MATSNILIYKDSVENNKKHVLRMFENNIKFIDKNL
jgi:hypothetical protein